MVELVEPEIAAVTVVHGRHDHLLRQRRMLREVAAGTPHVVVTMDDDDIAPLLQDDPDVTVVSALPDPRGLPLAAARNRGVETALAQGADLVVLLDVDCLPGPDLLPRYAEASHDAPEDLLCGPVTYLGEGVLPDSAADLLALTDPHAARPSPSAGELVRDGDHDLFWSLSFAVTPATWRRLGGFCEDYVGYGGEDTDFAMRLDAADGDLIWLGGADAYHQYHPTQKPPTQHLDDIVRNANLFATTWGWHPMEGWLEEFAARGLAHRDGPEWVVSAPVAQESS